MKDRLNLNKLLEGIRQNYETNPEGANLEYAQWRTDAFAEHRQSEKARKGGKAKKRKQWAEELAGYLAGLGLTFPKAWATIPEDENAPLELDEDTGFYRSDRGELLVVLDLVEAKEIGKMSRSNFQRRYFRPAKQNPDSN